MFNKHIPKKWIAVVLGLAAIATAVYFINANRMRLVDGPEFFRSACDTKALLSEIQGANYCEAHDECALLVEDYVNCRSFVNKGKLATLQNKINAFIGACPKTIKTCPDFAGNPYLACRANKCDYAERGEENVTAQTDKSEYAQGEQVQITITNNLQVPVFVPDQADISQTFARLSKKTEEGGFEEVSSAIAINSPSPLFKELQPQGTHAYNWFQWWFLPDHAIESEMPAGVYYFDLFFSADNYIHLKTNEFTITEEAALYGENECRKDEECVLSDSDCCPTCNPEAMTIWEAERRKQEHLCELKKYACPQVECQRVRALARCLNNQCVKTYEITGEVIETESVPQALIRPKEGAVQQTCNELNRVKIKEAAFGGPEREFFFGKDNRFPMREGSCYSLEYQKTEDRCEGDLIISLKEKPCVEVVLDKNEYQWSDEIEVNVANNSGTAYWYDGTPESIEHKLMLFAYKIDEGEPILLPLIGKSATPKPFFPGDTIKLPVLKIKEILPSLLPAKEEIKHYSLAFVYALDAWDTPGIPSAIKQFAHTTNRFTINLADAPRYYSDSAY